MPLRCCAVRCWRAGDPRHLGLIARGQGCPLGDPLDEVAVSVVIMSELDHEGPAAGGHEQMARRLSILEAARQIAKPLVKDGVAGNELARLRVALKAAARG